MTDDLVKQLRDWRRGMYGTGWLHLAESMDSVADHIEELEAKLTKAVEALAGVDRFVKDLAPYADPHHNPVTPLARACEVYAELKGKTE